MTDATSSVRAAIPRKRLRQLRQVKAMADLHAVCLDARRLIKSGKLAYADAYDETCDIAERNRLCARHGAEFVYEQIRAWLTAGGADKAGNGLAQRGLDRPGCIA